MKDSGRLLNQPCVKDTQAHAVYEGVKTFITSIQKELEKKFGSSPNLYKILEPMSPLDRKHRQKLLNDFMRDPFMKPYIIGGKKLTN
jgi:hypothetical protein